MPRKPADSAVVDAVQAIIDDGQYRKKLTPSSFADLVNRYPHREAASCYVYRRRPVIDRRQAGNKYSYIDIIPLGDEPMNLEERLYEAHGSGEYTVTLTDTNRQSPTQEVARTFLSLDDPSRPPKIDPAELVIEAAANKAIVEQYRQEGKLPNPNQNTESGAGDAIRELSKLTRDLVTARPAADPIQLAIDIRKAFGGDKPADSTDQALKIAALIESARADAAKPMELMFSTMTKVLELQASRQAPQSDFEQLAKLLDFAERLGGRRGDSGWGELAASLPATLGGVAQVLAQLTALRSGAAPLAAPPPLAPMPAPNQPSEDEESPMNIQALIAGGRAAIEAFQRGASGVEFARFLSSSDPSTYDTLAGLDESTVLGLLAAQPDLWAQLAPHEARVRRFLGEFYGAGDEPEGEAA